MTTPVLECRGCGPVEPDLRYRWMTNGRHHIGGYCPDCGKWIKWVKQTELGGTKIELPKESQTEPLTALQENDRKLESIADSLERVMQR